MTDLRQLLTDIGDRAGTYDVTERALAVTRRRRRRRTAAGTTAVALAVATIATWGLWPGAASRPPEPAASPSAPPLPTSCTLGSMPLPKGVTRGTASEVDPTGRYAIGGGILPASGDYQRGLVFWDGNTVRQPELPGRLQYFHDVNSSGTALASAEIDGKDSTWVYRDGAWTRLEGAAFGSFLNESGVVVGVIRRSDGDGPFNRPVRWRTPDSPMELLPMPPGVSGFGAMVRGIDDDGAVLMQAGVDGTEERAFVLRPDGSWQQLTTTVDGVVGRRASVYAIRGGWVAGQVLLPEDGSGGSGLRDVLWNLRTGQARVLERADPPVVNAHGWTVAREQPRRATSVPGTPLAKPFGTLWLRSPAGEGTALPAPSGLTAWDVSVSSMSDDGRVLVGYQRPAGNRESSDFRPVRWRCS